MPFLFNGQSVLAQAKNPAEAMKAAMSYARQGNWPKARASYEEVLALLQKPEEKAGVEWILGQIDVLEGKADAARKRWELVVQTPGVDSLVRVEAQLGIGEILLKEKRYDEALEAMSKALNFEGINPFNRYLIFQQRSKVFVEQKKFSEARDELFKIFDLQDPEGFNLHRTTWLDVGELYEQENKHDEARAAWDKVLQEEDPADAPGQAELRLDKEQAQLRIAKSYFTQKNYARAREEYQKVLVIDKVSGESRNEANAQLKAIDEAEKAPAAPAAAEPAPK